MNKYGERLREYRKKNGLTQNRMAEILSMPQGNYSRLEKGEQDIKLSMIENICVSLNISVDWFLGYSDECEDMNKSMRFYIEVVNTICEMGEDEKIEDDTVSIILKRINSIAHKYDIN